MLGAIARARYENIHEIPAEELSRVLLRAARAHPAYDWDCDVADEDAGKPWLQAGHPRACSDLKLHRAPEPHSALKGKARKEHRENWLP